MYTIEKDLQEFAQDFYISKNSSEKPKIESSLASIKKKLKQEFGDRILSIEIFGSFKRKTILPRLYDKKSDIDLLIVFDHENINVNPSTYRKHLHVFAEQFYPNSISYKSRPSVVIELNHINYDLVPAFVQEEGFFFPSDEVYIPKNDTEWMHTDIHGFSKKLESKNEKYNFNVKRIIRLLKAWNAKVGYPIESYELEQIIAEMNFSGDNIEQGFFYAIEQLPDEWTTEKTALKVDSLKENAELLYEALEEEDEREINKYLKKILPMPN
jgi:predicted nucleotidyltransferase